MEYKWNMDLIKKDKIIYNCIMADEKVSKKKEPLYSILLREFYKLDEFSFMKTLTNKMDACEIEEEKDIDPYLSKVSFDDTVTITYDFYQEILKDSPNLLKIFLKEFDGRFEQINKNEYDYQPMSGNTLYSKVLKKSFIEIFTYNNIVDITTLIHEYGHVLSAVINNRSVVSTPFVEFEAVFIEYLLFDYLQKKSILTKDCKLYKQYIIDEYNRGMIHLYNRYSLKKALEVYFFNNETYNFDKKDLVPMLLDFADCSKEELLSDLKYDICFYLPYLAAESYAFDFASKYRNDPERLINIYEQMIKITGSYGQSASYLNRKVKKLGLDPVLSYKKF